MKYLRDKGIDRIKDIHSNSEGAVAIFSVMIIMAILGLLTIGFSNITRQAQRRALDDHLSNQAFYAAESGVNMALHKLVAGGAAGANKKTSCKDEDDGYVYDIDTDNNISVSCILIDQTVPSIDNRISKDNSVVNHLEVADVSDFDIINIKWKPQDSNAIVRGRVDAGVPSLLSEEEWSGVVDGTGVRGVDILKVELVPVPDTGDYSRGSLVSSSYIFYLYPVSGNSVSEGFISTGNKGEVFPTHCGVAGEYRCQINITTAGSFSGKYKIRQTPMNGGSIESSISALRGGDELSIIGSQAVIDVTGKANDVLRRLEVRVDINDETIASRIDSGESPIAIFSGDKICKRYRFTGRAVGNLWKDDCDESDAGGEVMAAEVTVDPDPGSDGGDAIIGEWPDDSQAGPGHPLFIFHHGLLNESETDRSLVTGCTWDWGDGTRTVHPPHRCEYGYNTVHHFPDTSEEILRTNGSSGCRRYLVTLTMHFLPELGWADKSHSVKKNVPRGQANDRPDPDNPSGGICRGKWQDYVP